MSEAEPKRSEAAPTSIPARSGTRTSGPPLEDLLPRWRWFDWILVVGNVLALLVLPILRMMSEVGSKRDRR